MTDNSLERKHMQEVYVPFVIDAVYLAAHALNNLLQDNCPKHIPFNHCVKMIRVEGAQLLRYIRKTQFTGVLINPRLLEPDLKLT